MCFTFLILVSWPHVVTGSFSAAIRKVSMCTTAPKEIHVQVPSTFIRPAHSSLLLQKTNLPFRARSALFPSAIIPPAMQISCNVFVPQCCCFLIFHLNATTHVATSILHSSSNILHYLKTQTLFLDRISIGCHLELLIQCIVKAAFQLSFRHILKMCPICSKTRAFGSFLPCHTSRPSLTKRSGVPQGEKISIITQICSLSMQATAPFVRLPSTNPS